MVDVLRAVFDGGPPFFPTRGDAIPLLALSVLIMLCFCNPSVHSSDRISGLTTKFTAKAIAPVTSLHPKVCRSVRSLVREIGLDASAYGTHPLRRTICRREEPPSCSASTRTYEIGEYRTVAGNRGRGRSADGGPNGGMRLRAVSARRCRRACWYSSRRCDANALAATSRLKSLFRNYLRLLKLAERH